MSVVMVLFIVFIVVTGIFFGGVALSWNTFKVPFTTYYSIYKFGSYNVLCSPFLSIQYLVTESKLLSFISSQRHPCSRHAGPLSFPTYAVEFCASWPCSCFFLCFSCLSPFFTRPRMVHLDQWCFSHPHCLLGRISDPIDFIMYCPTSYIHCWPAFPSAALGTPGELREVKLGISNDWILIKNLTVMVMDN